MGRAQEAEWEGVQNLTVVCARPNRAEKVESLVAKPLNQFFNILV